MEGARVIGCSALLTTTMGAMRRVVELVRAEGLPVKVIVAAPRLPGFRAGDRRRRLWLRRRTRCRPRERPDGGRVNRGPFAARLRSGGPIVVDGAMGTALMEKGVPPGQCPEALNPHPPGMESPGSTAGTWRGGGPSAGPTLLGRRP